METDYTKVAEALESAKGIAWDGCHKIYILMDDEQVALMREYGYEETAILTSYMYSPAELLAEVKEWYEVSCGLRFIDAVTTNTDDPNAGFKTLIPQFAGLEV